MWRSRTSRWLPFTRRQETASAPINHFDKRMYKSLGFSDTNQTSFVTPAFPASRSFPLFNLSLPPSSLPLLFYVVALVLFFFLVVLLLFYTPISFLLLIRLPSLSSYPFPTPPHFSCSSPFPSSLLVLLPSPSPFLHSSSTRNSSSTYGCGCLQAVSRVCNACQGLASPARGRR